MRRTGNMLCGEGLKAGSAVPSCCRGAIFFARPEKGKSDEAAWSADKKLLEQEHRALCAAVAKVLRTPQGAKEMRQLYGVAFHDIYHAGQIRLLRRMMER